MLKGNFLKYVFLILSAILLVQTSGLPVGNIANKYFLEKQKFLFEIVHNIQEPLQNEDWIKMGKSLVIERTSYLDFNPQMDSFLTKVKEGNLLPLDSIFLLSDHVHLEQLKGLYYFLYNAQDFETLRQNICWARLNVQPQMFVFALTQALMKREDIKDLNLPKIYEIWPQHFLNDKYVRKLEHFNYVQWSKEEMFEDNSNTTSKSMCQVYRWWCRENLNFQIYQEKERMILPLNIYGDFRNSSKWPKALEDVSWYWLPVDFSREVGKIEELSSRTDTYLIEDKEWNAYWYYINMGLWLNGNGQNDMYNKSLRDWWFWNLQQIVARYKMEQKIVTPQLKLDPYLINFQNLKYQAINNKNSQRIWSFLNHLFAMTEKALNEQTYELQNGTRLHLNSPEHLEYFLNEIFALEKILSTIMSLPSKEEKPTVLHYYETMLRSQEFYHYAEILVNLYKSLKSNFEPYKLQDLQNLGITINDIDISPLKTYFEIVDLDVSNLMRSSDSYFENKLMWFKSLMARQPNLQHQPFKLVFNLTADKPQAVLVRTFIGLDCSADSEIPCSSSSSSEYFQLDTFVSSLATGFNIIDRDSKDFYGFAQHSLTYSELYHFTRLALNEEYEFPFNITLGNCRFPHHLKLPRGKEDIGLPVKFVFVISAYNYRFHKGFNLDCDFSSGILSFDDLPPGFPFDREISESIFMNDNILIKREKIYHDNELHFRWK